MARNTHPALAYLPPTVFPADPMTAALSHATNDALHNVTRARQVLHRNTVEYAARLIRAVLPEAVAITADTEDGELHEVRDGDGKAIYRAPFTPASPLSDGIADDVTALLRDAFKFGGLEDAGWETAADGLPYRSITLPTGNLAARGTAATAFPTPEGMATVVAEFTPDGTPAFWITGPNSMFTRETRDRVRAAIVNSGLEWTPGTMRIDAHWTVVRTGSSSDLTLACTALAATGAIDPRALGRTILIGELGLDGRVFPVRDAEEAINAARTAGYRHIIVAGETAENAAGYDGTAIYGVSTLGDAVAYLAQIGEINKR
ncbi:magnesium chelatase domain-containing protein [Streptomyces sp. NPDC003038]|uniref:magnesium chelatase domain-containing protein n=1 Tax=unclassified Streptomyces TaxID=2593676 RepID=UPI0033A32143